MPDITDIFNGEYLLAWECDDMIFIGFPQCTIHIPKADFEAIAKELQAIVTAWKAQEARN